MTFDSRGFKGETAHPRVLRWMGFFAIVLSIGCVGVGIANTMTKLMANANAYALTKASVGIWAPIPMFVTGIITSIISRAPNSSKRWAGMLSFFSAFLFSPVLVGVTSVEILNNGFTGTDNSLPIAIVVHGCLLFVAMFSIMAVIYFSTFGEDQMPLFQPEAILPPVLPVMNTTIVSPSHQYQGPAAGYRPMPLVPSSYTLPTAQTFATNMPSAYYQVAGAKMPAYASGFAMSA